MDKVKNMRETEVVISDKTANPAPLGLLGFGITTILLNLHNAGLFPINSMILAMGFAYGGIAQILASVMECRKGNTFGTVAFGSYGLFWWSLVLLLVIPNLRFLETSGTAAASADPVAMASYLFMWGLFTLVMFIATLKLKRGIQVIFISLAVLFFLLTAGEIIGSGLITALAGYEGIFTGAAAMYVGLAEVINETHGRDILPT